MAFLIPELTLKELTLLASVCHESRLLYFDLPLHFWNLSSEYDNPDSLLKMMSSVLNTSLSTRPGNDELLFQDLRARVVWRVKLERASVRLGQLVFMPTNNFGLVVPIFLWRIEHVPEVETV